MPQIPLAEGAVSHKGPAKKPQKLQKLLKPKLAEVRLSNTTLLPGTQTVWAQIDVRAPEAEDQTRPPVDLVPVVDCSGSMGSGPNSPREHAFEATRYVLKRLGGQDRSAVVVYASEVELLKGLSGDHQEAVERLKQVTLSGMTALAPALYEGIEQLGADPKRTQAVWLFTDGQANEGDTDPAVIAAKVKKAAKAGIKVATFGLGPSYNEDLLEAVAKAGGGGYYYLATPDDAPRAFAEELEGLLQITARQVKLDLKAAKGVSVKRLLGLDADKAPVRLGDLPSGVARTLVVELEVEGEAGDTPDLLEVSLSWRDLDDERQAESESVFISFEDDEEAVSRGADAEVLAKVAELEAAYAQAEAAKLADQGHFEQARALLGEHGKRLRVRANQAPAMALALNAQADEIETNLGWLQSAATYTSESAKFMKSSSYSRRTSRPSSAPKPPAVR